jgi:hypothetical protein
VDQALGAAGLAGLAQAQRPGGKWDQDCDQDSKGHRFQQEPGNFAVSNKSKAKALPEPMTLCDGDR